MLFKHIDVWKKIWSQKYGFLATTVTYQKLQESMTMAEDVLWLKVKPCKHFCKTINISNKCSSSLKKHKEININEKIITVWNILLIKGTSLKRWYLQYSFYDLVMVNKILRKWAVIRKKVNGKNEYANKLVVYEISNLVLQNRTNYLWGKEGREQIEVSLIKMVGLVCCCSNLKMKILN